jgi:hypothetical protein
MDFSESVSVLADKAQKIRGNLSTEEATKNALVMPFIQALGYDVFSPLEVVPEFVADIAGKKGEKVDYAIMQDGKPIMIIECKVCGTDLNAINRDQLHRYFLTLDSSIGILTDGLRYLFFSRSDDGKNMDTLPFMEFSLANIDPTLLPELRKLCKGKFDLQNTLDTVNELKFNRQVKLALASNLESPDMDFIDYLLFKAGIKGLRQKTKEERYANYTKRAFREFIAEQVDGRLKTALAATSKKEEDAQQVVAPVSVTTEPEITENEFQAFYLVKSLLMGVVAPERIHLRNAAGVGRSNVILDDSRNKPLLRLNFQQADRLFIGIIGEDKKDNWGTIETLDDILKYTEAIRNTASMYLAEKSRKVKEASAEG